MQVAYARGMISLEQRNRVYKVMHSMQLPFWHFTCNSELFYKVRTHPPPFSPIPQSFLQCALEEVLISLFSKFLVIKAESIFQAPEGMFDHWC